MRKSMTEAKLETPPICKGTRAEEDEKETAALSLVRRLPRLLMAQALVPKPWQSRIGTETMEKAVYRSATSPLRVFTTLRLYGLKRSFPPCKVGTGITVLRWWAKCRSCERSWVQSWKEFMGDYVTWSKCYMKRVYGKDNINFQVLALDHRERGDGCIVCNVHYRCDE
jgi:hypothetical protein